MDSDRWEIAKLAVHALGSITVAGLGYFVSRAMKRLESVQWANQTVIQRRLDIFQQVAPKLNRLLCFAVFVGSWKEVTPADAIRLKRETDEIMHVNRVLFSPELFDAYLAFMRTLFELYARTDGNAPLRVAISSPLGSRRNLNWWDDSLEGEFSISDIPSRDEVQAAYDALSECFRRDLYITRQELSLPGS